jgi:hypothetical protein
MRTSVARASGDAAEAPQLTAALHTEFLPVVRDGGTVQVDPTASSEVRLTLQALLDAAPPGAVVATASAARFLARRFEMAPLGATTAFRVVRNAEPGQTRFVGREREL